jgi:hypothetical protein
VGGSLSGSCGWEATRLVRWWGRRYGCPRQSSTAEHFRSPRSTWRRRRARFHTGLPLGAVESRLDPARLTPFAVAVAQLVEPRVVVPVVGGSSPLRHPSLVGPCSSADRAAAFEAACGGSTPPRATTFGRSAAQVAVIVTKPLPPFPPDRWARCGRRSSRRHRSPPRPDMQNACVACFEISVCGETVSERRGGAPKPPSPGNAGV